MTLDAAGICALDLVLGAASAGVGGSGGVGLEAETPLTAALRAAAGGPLLDRRPDTWASDDARLAIGEAWELARALAGVLASARPVEAADLGQPGGTGADARLADPVTLSAGVRKTRDTLTQDKSDLAALLPGPADPPPDAPTQSSIRDLVERLAGYGIGPGLLTSTGDADADSSALLIAARAVVAASEARLAAAAANITLASDPGTAPAAAVSAWRRAAQDLLGNGFPLLPVLGPANGDGASDDMFSASLGSPVLTASDVATRVRPWLLRVASVRPAVARWTQTLLYRDALGRGPTVRVAQVPLGASAGVGGRRDDTGSKCRPGRSPTSSPKPRTPPERYVNTRLSGFVVDTWVDTVPRRRVLAAAVTPDGAAGAPEPVATTGIAVNANAPNNEAPQAILLAMSPDRQRWDSDRLVAVLHDTMDLLRLARSNAGNDALGGPLASGGVRRRLVAARRTDDRPTVPARGNFRCSYAIFRQGKLMTLVNPVLTVSVEEIAPYLALLRPPSYTRLEPQSVTGDPATGLAMPVADPLWLLHRQWQFGEFIGEDAGSAVDVAVKATAHRLTSWRPGPPGTDSSHGRRSTISWSQRLSENRPAGARCCARAPTRRRCCSPFSAPPVMAIW